MYDGNFGGELPDAVEVYDGNFGTEAEADEVDEVDEVGFTDEVEVVVVYGLNVGFVVEVLVL